MRTLLSYDPAAITAYALSVLLPLTMVCLWALIAARGVFRRNPSTRYYLTLTALVCVLLSPLMVRVQDAVGFGLVTLSLPPYFSAASGRIAGASPALRTAAGNDASLVRTAVSVVVWAAVSLWAAGVAGGGIRLIQGGRGVSRLTDGARLWNVSLRADDRERLERVLGCPLPPIFLSSRVASPMAVGLLRPVVILPEGLIETLSPAPLRQVLLHECAHIVFRHTLGGLVERLAKLLFWPHPLVHALCRELARAREEVCDNVAVQEGGAACYARTLFTLALAQGTFSSPGVPSALALLESGISLEDRIAGLLDPRRDRMVRLKRAKLWAVLYAAVLVLGSTAVVRVAATNDKAKPDAFGAPDTLFLKRVAEAKAKQAAVTAGPSTARRYTTSAELLAAKREADARAKAERITIPVGHVELRRTDQNLVDKNQFSVWRDGRKIGQIHFQPGPRNPEERQPARSDELDVHRKAEAELMRKRAAEAEAQQ